MRQREFLGSALAAALRELARLVAVCFKRTHADGAPASRRSLSAARCRAPHQRGMQPTARAIRPAIRVPPTFELATRHEALARVRRGEAPLVVNILWSLIFRRATRRAKVFASNKAPRVRSVDANSKVSGVVCSCARR